MGANYVCGPKLKLSEDDWAGVDVRLSALREQLSSVDPGRLREAVDKVAFRLLAELDYSDVRSWWWANYVATLLEAAMGASPAADASGQQCPVCGHWQTAGSGGFHKH